MNCDRYTSTFLVGNDTDYILFKIAIDSAKQGLSVWFISVKPIERVPKGTDKPCKEILQLITFIYLSDYMDIMKHLNGIHKWKHLPNVVILKDFEQYCNLFQSEYDSTRTAFLTASLLNSVSFLSKRKKGIVLLLVSCSKGTDGEHILNKRLKVLCDIYFDNFLFQEGYECDELIEKIKQSFLNETTSI